MIMDFLEYKIYYKSQVKLLLAPFVGLLLSGIITHVTARACLQSEASTPVIRNVSHYTCDDNPYVNGCNIPIRIYKRIFRSDCNKHDICYACGSRYGVSRRSCDVMFGQNVADSCSFADYETWCRILTYVSYATVRINGHRKYSRNSPVWCANSWVSSCLYMN